MRFFRFGEENGSVPPAGLCTPETTSQTKPSVSKILPTPRKILKWSALMPQYASRTQDGSNGVSERQALVGTSRAGEQASLAWL